MNLNIGDDNVKTHKTDTPNSIHILNLPMIFLSPQHWAQNTTDNTTKTTCVTSTVLRFCGYAKTLRINPRTNTPIFRSTPDTLRYQAFTGTIDNFDDKSLLLSEHVITDNKVLDSEGNATDNEYNDEAIPMSD